MKINGINVDAEFGDPSLNNWIDNVRAGELRRLSLISPELVDEIVKSFIDAYTEAKNFQPQPCNFSVDEAGKIILPKGCLLHLTPIKSGKQTNYGKLQSIKEKGLLSLSLFEEGDDWDNEVPLQVSFHRCAKQQTIPEKYKAICERSHQEKVFDLGVIINTESEGIQKLLDFDTSGHRLNNNIDIGNGFKNPQTNEFYAYRLKKYPKTINTEAQKRALGFLILRSRPIVDGDDFAYLPIAVPPQYIAGFILSEQQEKNSELIEFLRKEFPNAILCSSQGEVIIDKNKNSQREF